MVDTANQFKHSFADVLTEKSNPEDLSLDAVENITSSLAKKQREKEK